MIDNPDRGLMEKGPRREVLIDTADDGVGCDHIVVDVEQWEARSGFHIPMPPV